MRPNYAGCWLRYRTATASAYQSRRLPVPVRRYVTLMAVGDTWDGAWTELGGEHATASANRRVSTSSPRNGVFSYTWSTRP